MRHWALIGAVSLLLCACQLALPGKGGADEVAANPITGDAVEVTSLDAPPASPPAATEAQPAPAAEPSVTEPPAAEPVAEPAATPVAAVVKSAAQLACEKRKGVWTSAGSGAANFCQKATRDGGRICKKSTDCEGYCLARSRSCAPIAPMFGCQDILNEDGRMLTECIN